MASIVFYFHVHQPFRIKNYPLESIGADSDYFSSSEPRLSNKGILENDTSILPDVLHKLLTDEVLYDSLIKNIKDASIRNGVGQVSNYILNFQQ